VVRPGIDGRRTGVHALAPFVLALLLAACATARLPSTPAERAPDRWHATLPHGGDAAALAGWWRRFDDPLLSDLIGDAQARNPTLAQALARVAEARAGVRSARAAHWPAVNAAAQAQRGAQPSGNFGASTQATIGLDALWEVDLFGVTQARVEAAQSRADCDALVKGLAVLTGSDEPALRTRLAASTARLPRPAAFAVATLPAQLLQQRPDIAAAERALVAAAADVGVAEADRWPRLTFSGTLGASSLRVGGSTLDGTAWGFGPQLVLPLFDAGLRAAREEAARARYDAARAALDGQLRRAAAEVEEALVRLDAATRREGEAQRAAQGFVDYFAAAEQRWRIGAGSLIDREEARRTALAAQSALIAVQRERVAAWITLYRSLGGGWNPSEAVPG
jgi:outer membrane protein TolC